MGGAFFMLAGPACALRAMFAADARAALRWLVAGSVALGLAGGTRISLLPVIVVLAVVAGLVRWRIDGGGRPLLRAAGRRGRAGGARAGALRAQLPALRRMDRVRRALPDGLGDEGEPALRVRGRVDLLLRAPVTLACKFPFLFAHWKTVHGLNASLVPVARRPQPRRAINRPVRGRVVRVARRRLRPNRPDRPSPARSGRRHARRRRAGRAVAPARWIWLGPLLYTLGGVAPVLMLFATTMRYELDFSSGLLLLSALAGWRLLALPASRAGRRAVGGRSSSLLAAVTIAAGLLLGYGGYFNHFGRHNPALIRGLEKALSVCPVQPPRK